MYNGTGKGNGVLVGIMTMFGPSVSCQDENIRVRIRILSLYILCSILHFAGIWEVRVQRGGNLGDVVEGPVFCSRRGTP